MIYAHDELSISLSYNMNAKTIAGGKKMWC
jgi:hypothetical protein